MSSSDEEFFPSNASSSHLASIFENFQLPRTTDFNHALTFVAPKQPKPKKDGDLKKHKEKVESENCTLRKTESDKLFNGNQNLISSATVTKHLDEVTDLSQLPDILFAKPAYLYRSNDADYFGKFGLVLVDEEPLKMTIYKSEGVPLKSIILVHTVLCKIMTLKSLLLVTKDEEITLSFDTVSDLIECAIILELKGCKILNILNQRKGWSVEFINGKVSLQRVPDSSRTRRKVLESLERIAPKLERSKLVKKSFSNTTVLPKFISLAFEKSDLHIKDTSTLHCTNLDTLGSQLPESALLVKDSNFNLPNENGTNIEPSKLQVNGKKPTNPSHINSDNISVASIVTQTPINLDMEYSNTLNLENHHRLESTEKILLELSKKIEYAIEGTQEDTPTNNHQKLHDLLVQKFELIESKLKQLDNKITAVGNKSVVLNIEQSGEDQLYTKGQYEEEIKELQNQLATQRLKDQPFLLFYDDYGQKKLDLEKSQKVITKMEEELKTFRDLKCQMEKLRGTREQKIKGFRIFLRQLMSRTFTEIMDKVENQLSPQLLENVQSIVADNLRMCTFNIIDYLRKESLFGLNDTNALENSDNVDIMDNEQSGVINDDDDSQLDELYDGNCWSPVGFSKLYFLKQDKSYFFVIECKEVIQRLQINSDEDFLINQYSSIWQIEIQVNQSHKWIAELPNQYLKEAQSILQNEGFKTTIINRRHLDFHEGIEKVDVNTNVIPKHYIFGSASSTDIYNDYTKLKALNNILPTNFTKTLDKEYCTKTYLNNMKYKEASPYLDEERHICIKKNLDLLFRIQKMEMEIMEKSLMLKIDEDTFEISSEESMDEDDKIDHLQCKIYELKANLEKNDRKRSYVQEYYQEHLEDYMALEVKFQDTNRKLSDLKNEVKSYESKSDIQKNVKTLTNIFMEQLKDNMCALESNIIEEIHMDSVENKLLPHEIISYYFKKFKLKTWLNFDKTYNLKLLPEERKEVAILRYEVEKEGDNIFKKVHKIQDRRCQRVVPGGIIKKLKIDPASDYYDEGVKLHLRSYRDCLDNAFSTRKNIDQTDCKVLKGNSGGAVKDSTIKMKKELISSMIHNSSGFKQKFYIFNPATENNFN